jgi:hypothetical protein
MLALLVCHRLSAAVSQADGRTLLRAIVSSYITNYALQSGMTAVFFGQWAAAACEIDGTPCPAEDAHARSGAASGLTELLEILTDGVYAQPPWHALAMLSTRLAAQPSPALVQPSDMTFAALSHAYTGPAGARLCNVTLSLTNLAALPAAITVTFANAGADADAGPVLARRQLTCASLAAVNTPANRTACQPAKGAAAQFAASRLTLTLPAQSFTVLTVDALHCN